ncbi:MAG: hypothetical protein COW84_07605 [Gammaproteobacteria bacterium CG22_combo_CG10-13_8_21_14_all_40_8]|nr:MAG: hypothetical protein COW84_07605 [Gammaproteobacteria bacterium CG22_combo_CG10-13_8_21_14_all_40_8]
MTLNSFQHGRGRIENILMIVFVTLLMGYLIHKLIYIVEKTEQLSVEIRIKQLHSAAKWKFSELMLTGDLSKINEYEGANPFLWISFNAPDLFQEQQLSAKEAVDKNATKLESRGQDDLQIDNYLGSLKDYNWLEIPEKNWFYDSQNQQIVYKLAYPQWISIKGSRKDKLAWRLKVVKIKEPDPFGLGIRDRAESFELETITPYLWKKE